MTVPREPKCRVYWGSHGCMLDRGHEGHHLCSCALDDEGDLRPHADSVPEDHPDSGNVGCWPFYGEGTRFYGEDVKEGELGVASR